MLISTTRWTVIGLSLAMLAGTVGCQSVGNMFTWYKKKPNTPNLAVNQPPNYLTPPSVSMTPYPGTDQVAGAQAAGNTQVSVYDGTPASSGYAATPYPQTYSQQPQQPQQSQAGATNPGYYTGQYPTAVAANPAAASAPAQQGFYAPRYSSGAPAYTADARNVNGTAAYSTGAPAYQANVPNYQPPVANGYSAPVAGGYAPSATAGNAESYAPAAPPSYGGGYPAANYAPEQQMAPAAGYAAPASYPNSEGGSFAPGSTGRGASFQPAPTGGY